MFSWEDGEADKSCLVGLVCWGKSCRVGLLFSRNVDVVEGVGVCGGGGVGVGGLWIEGCNTGCGMSEGRSGGCGESEDEVCSEGRDNVVSNMSWNKAWCRVW